MTRLIPALSVLCLIATSSLAHAAPQGLLPQANQTDSAVTAETRRIHSNASVNILDAARAMPDKYYTMRPPAGLTSFGALVSHVADTQANLCGNINGYFPLKKPATMTKTAVLAHLEQTSSQCNVAFSELSAENAGTMVKTSAGDITHIAALVRVASEESEGYGQMKVYFGLHRVSLPVSADAIGKGGKAPAKAS